MSRSIEVIVCQGILCADFNEGRLVIDTGSPVSLGPNIAVKILDAGVQLNPSFGTYTWESVRQSLPFDAVGLVGVDAFSGSTIGFDIGNQILTRIDEPIEGNPVPFAMGSPVIECSIGEEKLRCVLDTGAGLSYLRDSRLATLGQKNGNQTDFHPMLGKFDVDTVTCSLMAGGKLATEIFGLATENLQALLENTGIDGILGTTFFAQGVVEVDFANEIVGLSMG
jgi:hypothetical protein